MKAMKTMLMLVACLLVSWVRISEGIPQNNPDIIALSSSSSLSSAAAAAAAAEAAAEAEAAAAAAQFVEDLSPVEAYPVLVHVASGEGGTEQSTAGGAALKIKSGTKGVTWNSDKKQWEGAGAEGTGEGRLVKEATVTPIPRTALDCTPEEAILVRLCLRHSDVQYKCEEENATSCVRLYSCDCPSESTSNLFNRSGYCGPTRTGVCLPDEGVLKAPCVYRGAEGDIEMGGQGRMEFESFGGKSGAITVQSGPGKLCPPELGSESGTRIVLFVIGACAILIFFGLFATMAPAIANLRARAPAVVNGGYGGGGGGYGRDPIVSR